jgi:hypothetical protein
MQKGSVFWGNPVPSLLKICFNFKFSIYFQLELDREDLSSLFRIHAVLIFFTLVSGQIPFPGNPIVAASHAPEPC